MKQTDSVLQQTNKTVEFTNLKSAKERIAYLQNNKDFFVSKTLYNNEKCMSVKEAMISHRLISNNHSNEKQISKLLSIQAQIERSIIKATFEY